VICSNRNWNRWRPEDMPWTERNAKRT